MYCEVITLQSQEEQGNMWGETQNRTGQSKAERTMAGAEQRDSAETGAGRG